MPALTYTVTDPVSGSVFKSRRKTRPYGAVIVDGPDGPRVDAWAGRPDLLAAYHRRAVNGTRFAAPQVTARTAIATESHPAIRARLPRTLAGLSSHPWVESVSDERAMGAGIHVYLRPGFVWAGTTSAVIESTVREACEAFREVAWDPAAWGEACGASPAEVAALTGEATPAEATPAPATGRRLNPLAQILLARLEAADGQWLMVEAAPIVDTLKGLGWLQRSDVRGVIGPEGIPAVECRITAAGLAALGGSAPTAPADAPRPTLPGEATPPPAPSHGEAAPAPSIAGAALEASAALNAEGEAATARIFDRLGRIRAGLTALAEADAAIIAADARPTLPGEATPPPAPSHGEAAPTLPELRADAAAGRPVSLSAVARAAQSEMAARRAARRAG